ncbi:hypothetical protein GF420_03860 [candidate division GN15 bacterium]|nr:hypothetical protein [candidate division GN15 bacterium]
MDDSYFRDRISGYFDKNLPPDEYQLVDDYLRNSEEGRQLLEELGRLDEFVQREQELTGAEDFWEQQAQKIEAKLGFASTEPDNVERLPRRSSRGMVWKLTAAAASIAVLIFIGVHQSDIFGPEDIPRDADRPLGAQSEAMPPRQNELERATEGAATGAIDTARAKTAPDEIIEKELPADDRDELLETRIPDVDETSPTGRQLDLPPDADEEPAPEEPIRMAEPAKPVPPPSRQAAPGAAARTEEIPLGDTAVEKHEEFEQMRRDVLPSQMEAAGDQTELAHYRAERSRLMALLNGGGDSIGLVGETTPAMKSLTAERRAEPIATVADVRGELLEACYRIASLTPDSTERAAMVTQIRGMATDSTSSVQKLARGYLDKLK